ncbi:riboflavin synthase [bacterium]|nr:riboflavin synthase [bacterium]
MFTGIVENIAKVKSVINWRGLKKIEFEWLSGQVLAKGGSVSVNGVCLTITDFKQSRVFVEVVKETLDKSNLSSLRSGDYVNIETPLKYGGLLDGHFIQGHVDCVSKIEYFKKVGTDYRLGFKIDSRNKKYVVNKGFIGVDGMSLTVANLKANTVEVAIVPYTYENTVLKHRRVGDKINIEFDVLGKYIENFIK